MKQTSYGRNSMQQTAAPDRESRKELAKLAQKTEYPAPPLQALVYLPAADRSRLQCVSLILIWLVLVFTDLWKLLVDLLYD